MAQCSAGKSRPMYLLLADNDTVPIWVGEYDDHPDGCAAAWRCSRFVDCLFCQFLWNGMSCGRGIIYTL